MRLRLCPPIEYFMSLASCSKIRSSIATITVPYKTTYRGCFVVLASCSTHITLISCWRAFVLSFCWCPLPMTQIIRLLRIHSCFWWRDWRCELWRLICHRKRCPLLWCHILLLLPSLSHDKRFYLWNSFNWLFAVTLFHFFHVDSRYTRCYCCRLLLLLFWDIFNDHLRCLVSSIIRWQFLLLFRVYSCSLSNSSFTGCVLLSN